MSSRMIGEGVEAEGGISFVVSGMGRKAFDFLLLASFAWVDEGGV